MRLAPVVALLGALLLVPAHVSAEPQLEIHPARSHCVVPFEIFASGLPPEKDVLVDMVVGGVTTGSVAGSSEVDGRFWSPIPRVLLPCDAGGVVTASVRIDGQPIGLSTTFEIAEPIVPPVPPAVGDSPHSTVDNGDSKFTRALGGTLLALAMVTLALSHSRNRNHE